MTQSRVISSLILLFCSSFALAQTPQGVIAGAVKTTDGQPASSINVFLKGTNYGTSSDKAGNFRIEASAGSYTLVVSSIAAHRQEIPIVVEADGDILMRITEEQRAMIQKAADKTPTYIHMVTNPANAICSLDSATLQQVQSYLGSGNKRNYLNLARFIRRDVDGKKWFSAKAGPAAESVADVLFHLDENVWFDTAAEYENYLREKGIWQEGVPRVAMVGGLNDPFGGNRENIDSMIVSFQRAGMNIFPVASAMKRLHFLKEINPDAVLYFPHGRLTVMGRADETVEWLRERNIPVFAPLSLTQTHAEWEADPQGMMGGFLSQSVVMPELDGAIYPYVVNAQEVDDDGIYLFRAIPERLANFTKIVSNFVGLKRLPNAEKRVAIYYYSGIGTLAAQGLETVPSLHNLLRRLAREGYNVTGLPSTSDELGVRLKSNKLVLGNIALIAQPPAAEGDDTFAIVHGAGIDPPQTYIDAYINDFHPHAMIHFGAHGSLEFTPGKQVALSGNDWPDRLVGTVPHFYYYTIGNVGESVMAKRRSYATLISYLTPPFTQTGARGRFATLQQAIAEGNAAGAQKIAVQMGLHRELRLDSLQPWSEADIERLDNFAEEIANEKMTGELYTAGVAFAPDKIRSTVMAMSADPIAYSFASLDKLRGVRVKEGVAFTKYYLEPAKAIVAKLLSGQVADSAFICALAGITRRELAEAAVIFTSPQDKMMAAMTSVMDDIKRSGKKVGSGHSSWIPRIGKRPEHTSQRSQPSNASAT